MNCDEHGRTATLLNEVFSPEPAVTEHDLHWYYCENPRGDASVGRVESAGRRLGNYALIPQDYVSGDHVIRLGLGVDLSVSPDSRGSGAFRRTVEDSYVRGQADGLDGILGVANANSAPRMVESMGWRHMDPLGVRLVAPLGSGRATSHAVTDAWLDSEASGVLDGLAHHGVAAAYTPRWDGALLRWRLARSHRRYVVHDADDAVVITTRTTIGRMPIAVVLKVFTRAERLSSGRVAAIAARHHRTPAVLYWGVNASAPMRGLPLPQQRMPSPLELVLHAFHDDWDRDRFELATFEFLDFDGF